MKLPADWEDYFASRILQRGLNYYHSGAILDLTETECGYEAVVLGSEEYAVDISITPDGELDMLCDCPYAEQGENCKHMAAVLYAVQDNPKRVRKEKIDIKMLIQQAPEQELRDFVIDLAKRDNSVRKQVIRIFSPSSSYNKESVDELISMYPDRYGFINYIEEFTD